MARYITKPRASIYYGTGHEYDDWNNDIRASEVTDTGDWSSDQPTGVLTPDGDMIYRAARQIGFMADNDTA